MAELKLTKSQLRIQQQRLVQLEKYLPTLKLKKAMLQLEVAEAKNHALQLETQLEKTKPEVAKVSSLLSMDATVDMDSFTKVKSLQCEVENIAGVDVPVFRSIEFEEATYLFSQTPIWLDRMIELVRDLKQLAASFHVAHLRVEALEKELRAVSIRVNLFEKILIPRAIASIKKIKIFLQDQELASVGRAKVAKVKHRMDDAVSLSPVSQEAT